VAKLSEEVKATVRKTAEWLAKNMDKKSVIMDMSKSDPKLRYPSYIVYV
jgi:hypothetical protein